MSADPPETEEMLDELRQANPVDADSLPSSRSPESAAQLDEILGSCDRVPRSAGPGGRDTPADQSG